MIDPNTSVDTQSKLFTPIVINGLHIKNRIVKAPTMESMATEDGAPTDQLIRHYKRAAKGGCGLMMMGLCYVNKEGKAYFSENGIYDDKLIPEWKRFTNEIHEAGGKIVMQIVMAGGRSIPDCLKGERQKRHRRRPISFICIGRKSWKIVR